MSKKLCYIESKSVNPAYNLALEQYVFDALPKDRRYFMLWQNHNSVIVGKNQNTVEEVNGEFVKKHEVKVVRRLSGGGAVYHDMGNLNFTFIDDANEENMLDMKLFIKPVIATLKKFGVHAEMTGRNDIVISGKKFSGNSQYIKDGRVMHHGTIMFDSDLDFVSQVLNVSADKIQSKGLKSVKSRVTNIKEHLDESLDLRTFMDELKRNVFGSNDVKEYMITVGDESRINQIKESKYERWEWNYGFSPKYNVLKERRIEGCGKVEVYMGVEDGNITTFHSYGDYFGVKDTSELERVLVGQRLTQDDIKRAIQNVNISEYYANMDATSFVDMLTS